MQYWFGPPLKSYTISKGPPFGYPNISSFDKNPPEVGAKECMEKKEKERKKEQRKSVLTMASYACKVHHWWRKYNA